MTRRLVSGLAIAVAYLVVAAGTFQSGLIPIRPLYEGTAPPPPYRWVEAPRDVPASDLPAEAGEIEFRFDGEESQASNVNTGDGQFAAIFPPGAFEKEPGAEKIVARAEPLDPTTFGEPPEGVIYDGNAYHLTVVYQPSGNPVRPVQTVCGRTTGEPSKCSTVIMRYAFGATEIHRHDAGSWNKLDATAAHAALQIFADTAEFGTFVALAPPEAFGKPAGRSRGDFVAFALGLAAILGGTFIARTRAARSKGKVPAKKGAGKAPKKAPGPSKRRKR